MEVDTAQQLLSPRGRALLDSLPPYQPDQALQLAEGLRSAGYDAGLVAAALTQSRLRSRAVAKLGEFAAGMLFTPDGLEQATRLELAARHAARFRGAGVRHVLDLSCGLGADAMAMASLDLGVTAVEADPATAALAGYNLRHFPQARVLTARAQDVPLGLGPGLLGVWLDPSRRQPGRTDASGRSRRVFSLAAMSPPWDFVLAAAQQVPATGAKLSPSFPVGALPPGAQGQWTSFDGELLECVVWWGPLALTPGRTATVVRAGREVTVTQADSPGLGPVSGGLPDPGDWLYDPDPAVLRAGLTGALIAAVDGRELSTGVGYVTGARRVDVAYARRLRVLAALPLRTKVVRGWLRERRIGRLTVKKRGLPVDTEEWRRNLRLDGRGELATVVLTRAGTQSAVVVVEPA